MTDEPDWPIEIPSVQIREADGLVRGDVGRRDYRLVSQSKHVVAFNPYFNGSLSEGMEREILYAIRFQVAVHVFQDDRHDPKGEANTHFLGGVSALGPRVGTEYITFHDSPEAALNAVAEGD